MRIGHGLKYQIQKLKIKEGEMLIFIETYCNHTSSISFISPSLHFFNELLFKLFVRISLPYPHQTPTSTSTSSEFLYLGTLVSSREPPPPPVQNDAKAPPPPAPTLNYHRLGSPELHPLPPLPRQGQMYSNAPPAAAPENQGNENEHDNEEEEFFSPRGSTAANNASPYRTRLSPDAYNGGDAAKANEFNKSRSLNSLNCNSPAYSISPGNRPSVVLNTGSREACNRSLPTAWSASRAHCGGSSLLRRRGSREQSRHFRRSRRRRGGWWHHPGLLPAGFGFLGCRESAACSTAPSARCWDAAPLNGPPELVAPSRKVVVQNVGPEKGSLGNSESKNEENLKPKLKPLHWDKVRASSDRAMVWDQLKSSSFQLNEEMIETYSW